MLGTAPPDAAGLAAALAVVALELEGCPAAAAELPDCVPALAAPELAGRPLALAAVEPAVWLPALAAVLPPEPDASVA